MYRAQPPFPADAHHPVMWTQDPVVPRGPPTPAQRSTAQLQGRARRGHTRASDLQPRACALYPGCRLMIPYSIRALNAPGGKEQHSTGKPGSQMEQSTLTHVVQRLRRRPSSTQAAAAAAAVRSHHRGSRAAGPAWAHEMYEYVRPITTAMERSRAGQGRAIGVVGGDSHTDRASGLCARQAIGVTCPPRGHRPGPRPGLDTQPRSINDTCYCSSATATPRSNNDTYCFLLRVLRMRTATSGGPWRPRRAMPRPCGATACPAARVTAARRNQRPSSITARTRCDDVQTRHDVSYDT